jgi:hypothetical protein
MHLATRSISWAYRKLLPFANERIIAETRNLPIEELLSVNKATDGFSDPDSLNRLVDSCFVLYVIIAVSLAFESGTEMAQMRNRSPWGVQNNVLAVFPIDCTSPNVCKRVHGATGNTIFRKSVMIKQLSCTGFCFTGKAQEDNFEGMGMIHYTIIF